MHVQINYSGPAEKFSWILPVMFQPDIEVGSDAMFGSLFEQTRPTFTFDIDDNGSTTCEKGLSQDFPCAMMSMAFGDDAEMANRATVVEDGSVGPFDYVMIQPSKVDPGNSVFQWLEENGYDQPEEAFPLINYYAEQQQIFVALRLAKGTETGEIQPIILNYTLPGEMKSVACVPIQLTSIAAAADMPVQIYLFSDIGRGFPTNYFHAELDDTQVDWLGCRNSPNSPNCYINDMRQRLSSLLQEEGIDGHAFVTEYAGPADVMEDSIRINIDQEVLQELADANSQYQELLALLLDTLAEADVPDIPLVETILDQYTVVDQNIPVLFTFGCDDSKIFQPQRNCHEIVGSNRNITNATALIQDLMTRVINPAAKAQEFVDSYKYLTRMYGQLSPEQMNKDPFFAFKTDLPDVSNVHKATAVPTCNDGSGSVTGLDITIDDGTTFFQPAQKSCGNWQKGGEASIPVLLGSDSANVIASTGRLLSAIGYQGEEDKTVSRNSAGLFPKDVIADLVQLMNSRVPDQTIMPYNRTYVLLTADTAGATGTEMSNNENEEEEKAKATAESPEKDMKQVEEEKEAATTSSAKPGHVVAKGMNIITMLVVVGWSVATFW